MINDVKRLCALICTLAVMMTICISIPVTAAKPAAQNGDGLEQALLAQLGILSEDIKLDAAVTRGEAVKLALLLDKTPVSGVTGVFSDVNAQNEYAPFIEAAYRLGMVSGYSDGTFQPSGTITYAELVKLLLTVCGYGEFAALSGGFPAGYLQRARMSGLADGVGDQAAGSFIAWETAAKLAYNALHIDLMELTKIGGGEASYQVKVGDRLLEKRFDLKTVSGTVTANSLTSMYAASGAVRDGIAIDGVQYRAAANYDQYLGWQTDAYVDAGNQVIFLALNKQNRTASYMGDDVTDASKTRVSVQTDKKSSYTLHSSASYFKNGVYAGNLGTELVTEADLQAENTRYALLDNNGDGAYDLVFAERYQYYQVKSVDLSERLIYDKSRNFVIEINEKDTLRYLDGTPAELDDLKYNDIIGAKFPDGVTPDQDREQGLAFVIVDGVVSGIASGGAGMEITIGQERFSINGDFGLSDEKLEGQSGSFYLDAGGKILAYEAASAFKNAPYAYVAAMASDSAFGDEVQVKILLPNEGLCVKNLSSNVTAEQDGEKLTSDGKTLRGPEKVYGIRDKIIGRLVKVQINGEGEISRIELPRQLASGQRGEKNEFNYLPMETYKTRGDDILSDTYRLPKTALVFTVPEDASDDKVYRVSTVSEISRGEDFECELYSVGDNYIAGAALIRQADATQAAIGVESNLFIVQSVGVALNEEGEQTPSLTGMYGGEEKSFAFRRSDTKARNWINPSTTVVPVLRDVKPEDLMMGDILQITQSGGLIDSFRVMYLRPVYNEQGERIRGDAPFARQGSDDMEEIFEWAGLQWPFVSKAMLFVNGTVETKEDAFFTIDINEHKKNVFDHTLQNIYYVNAERKYIEKVPFNNRDFVAGKQAFVTFVWGRERDVVVYQ